MSLGQQGALLTGEASAVDQASRQLYWAVRASARGDNHGGAPAVLVVLARGQKISCVAVLQQLHVRDDVQDEKLSGAGDTEDPVRWPCGPPGSQLASRDYQAGARDPQFDQRQGRCWLVPLPRRRAALPGAIAQIPAGRVIPAASWKEADRSERHLQGGGAGGQAQFLHRRRRPRVGQPAAHWLSCHRTSGGTPS